MPTVMLIYRTRNGRVLHQPTFPASRGSFFSARCGTNATRNTETRRSPTQLVTYGAKCHSRVFDATFSLFFSFFFSFFYFLFLSFKYALNIFLPFKMFDNIFVGSSAVFPNCPGPVDHKKKRHLRYDGETQNRETESSRERKIT